MSFLDTLETEEEVLGNRLLRWHRAAPGPRLARWLEELDVAGLEELTDFDLVELVAASERVAAWAQHLARRAAAKLADRPSMQARTPDALALDLTPERVTGAELAMRLGRSPRAAQQLVREGRLFDGVLAATGRALREGLIDVEKATTLATLLDGVPGQLAVTVQDAVLPRAPERTKRQLAHDVRAALVELDPVEAADRHAKAREERFLTKPTPLPDGMAGLWLRTDAVEAHALFDAVDAAARSARAAGDPRTLAQLRADLLVSRGLHCATCSPGGGPAGSGPTGGGGCRSGGIRADVRVLVPLSTLVGTADEPAELAGHGPIDPATARALALGGTWRRLVTDPTSGVVLDVGRTRYRPPPGLAELVRFRDRTCVRPGCEVHAWASELDHTVPFRPRGDTSRPSGDERGGATAADNLGVLSKDCHTLKTHAGFELEQLAPGDFWWTTPTGHRYRRPPEPPLRSMAGGDDIHELRADLDELAGFTLDARRPRPRDLDGSREERRAELAEIVGLTAEVRRRSTSGHGVAKVPAEPRGARRGGRTLGGGTLGRRTKRPPADDDDPPF